MHDQMGDVTIVDISATRLNEDGTPGDEILSCNQKGAEVGPHVENEC